MPVNKKVTLLGASGFIGRSVVRRLAAEGHQLDIITRSPKNAHFLDTLNLSEKVTTHICPKLDETSLYKITGNADTVINLIGILFEKKNNTFQEIHVNLTDRIARVAKQNGVKSFIQMSALGADPNSLSLYAKTKAAGEKTARRYFPDATILRPSVVFGRDDTFINLFAKIARFSPVLPLIGGGHTKFQPVFVDDVAEAIAKILATPSLQGQILQLGGPDIFSFRELLQLILKMTGQRRFLVPLPWKLATLEAALFELMPHPLLTRDQIILLRSDNILTPTGGLTFGDLGIAPHGLETTMQPLLGH